MGFCSRDLFSHARKQCGENGSVLSLKYLKVENEKKHSRSIRDTRATWDSGSFFGTEVCYVERSHFHNTTLIILHFPDTNPLLIFHA